MLKLDNNLLEEIGLGALPEDQKRQMLQHIYETLELRVGTQLANQMTDKQLEEFERFIDAGGDGNQAQALQWLETNLPNYKQVVQDVFDALKTEVKGMAPQLLQAAAQQTTIPQQAQPSNDQPVYQPVEPPQYQAPTPVAAPSQPPASSTVPQQPIPSAPPVGTFASPSPAPAAPAYGMPQQPVQTTVPAQDPVQSTSQPFAQPVQPVAPAAPVQWQPPQPAQPDPAQPAQVPDPMQWQPPQPPQQ